MRVAHSANDDARSMYLAQPHQPSRRHRERLGDGGPAVDLRAVGRARPERPCPGREEMRSEPLERPADHGQAPGGVNPFEAVGKLYSH